MSARWQIYQKLGFIHACDEMFDNVLPYNILLLLIGT